MVLRFCLLLAFLWFWGCGNDYERDNPSDYYNIKHPDNITYGSLLDSRDNKTYKTVVIDNQTWMAENLNYNAESSRCNYCNIYGRLYDWATAMNVCPTGWHLPSQAEWNALSTNVQRAQGCSGCDAKHLKAGETGVDNYGFNALLGGYGSSGGYFYDVGYIGYWWSSSENNADNVYNMCMRYNREDALWGSSYKAYLLSVRCVQD